MPMPIGAIANVGLVGTHGIYYGPLPVWIYQVLLLATGGHLLALVSLRSVLFMLITAAALVDIAKTTGWWKWFVPIILAGPYLWLFGRDPWDNTFCIPFGAVLIAAHLH